MREMDAPPHVLVWAPAGAMRGHAPYLVLVFAAAFLMSLSLFHFRLPWGYDAFAYPLRTAEFYSLLSQGHFFPTWAPDLNFAYGSPVLSYQTPLLYYIAAVPRVAGMSLAASINMACFILMLTAGYGTYLLMCGIVGRRGACLAAVAYLTGPYLLFDLYPRTALAEYSALAFIPLVFWALGPAMQGGMRLIPLCVGALCVAALQLSHNFVALITIPAATVYVILWAVAARSWRRALQGALVLGMGVGLSAYFWLPALADTGFVKIERLVGGGCSYDRNFMFVHELIYSRMGRMLSVAGPSLGVIQVMGLIAAAVLLRRGKSNGAVHAGGFWFFFWVAMGSSFMVCADSILVWRALPVLQYGQFPLRFLSLATFAVAVCFGYLGPWIDRLGKSGRNRAFGVILVALLLSGFIVARPEKSRDVQDSSYTPSSISASGATSTFLNEWEPVWVHESPKAVPTRRAELLSGVAQVSVAPSTPLDYAVGVDAATKAVVRLNTFYFPAWKTTVDGQPFMPNMNNRPGVMDFTVPPGKHELRVTLSRTVAGVAGATLSFISLVLLIGLVVALRVFRRVEMIRRWAVPATVCLLLAAAGFAFMLNDAGAMPVTANEALYHGAAVDRTSQWFGEFISNLSRCDVAKALGDDLVLRYWSAGDEAMAIPRFLAAASHGLLGWMPDQVVAYRAGGVLLYLALAVAVLMFLKRLYGWPAALFGAAGVLLIPPLYGYAHINTGDFPAAALGFMAVAAFYLGIEDRRWSVAFGILFGLALNCNVEALFLPVILLPWALLFHRRKCIPNLIAMFVIAPMVAMMTWPWLWHHPLARLREYWTLHAAHAFQPEYYMGTLYGKATAPWHFPFVMMLVSVPAGILAMLFLGLGRWVRHILTDDKTALLTLGFLLPLVVHAMPFMPRHDGARLILCCFPFAACVAGVGFGALYVWMFEWTPRLIGRLPAQKLSHIPAGLRTSAVGAAVASALGLAVLAGSCLSMRAVHPYEAVGYYNLLVGRRAGAHKLGFRSCGSCAAPEVVDYINRNFGEGASILNNAGAYSTLMYYQRAGALRADIGFSSQPIYIVMEANETRFPAWGRTLYRNGDSRWELVKTFERGGVPVLKIFKWKGSG